VIWHNKLKEIAVRERKLMSDTTFEKYLAKLVDDKRVFKIREKKVRQRITILGEKEEKRYIQSKGRPVVYYTTQKRLVRLKPNFIRFCKKEMESLINQFSEFSKIKEKNPSEKEIIDRINKFSTSIFILENIMNSVNSLAHYWQDFRWVIDEWSTRIYTFKTLFYRQIRDNHRELYEKILTENQLAFLKSNEIHPFNLQKK
jgi:hypothetical protein